MKVLIYVLAIVFTLTSCSVFTAQYKANTGKAVVAKSNPDMYEYKDGKVGDIIGKYIKSAPFEVDFSGAFYMLGAVEPKYMVISDEGKTFCLMYPDIMPKMMYEVSIQSPNFSVPIEKEREVWSRAVSYVNQKSDMKIQTQTDFMLETFNPLTAGKKGFRITKTVTDKEASFNVDVFGDLGVFSGELQVKEAQKCAYYMRTGIMPN